MPPAYLRAPSLGASDGKQICTAPAPKGKRRNKPCQQCGKRHTPGLEPARSALSFFAGKPR